MKRLSIFVAACVLAGCSANDPRLSSGLKVTVEVDSSSKAECVRVIATPEQGTTVPTRSIPKKDEITVAVYKGEDWSGRTTVVARGYSNCTADVSDFIEESAAEVRDTLEGEVTLILKGKPVVADPDGDGHTGADDCDENDAQRFVGNAELCNSTKDNNCSNTTGCDDSACTGACAANGLGTCQGGVCTGSTELSCVDGSDNDGDGRIDCMDSDCGGSSCDDGNACTGTDVCQGDGGCGGAALPNNCGPAPTGTCLFGAGACNPADGGCMYRARDAGLSCSDGNACTNGDLCLVDGGCNAGVPKICNTPGSNVCLSANGVCNTVDAGCSYPVLLGNSCNDGNACSDGDMCQQDAGCRGSPKVCYQTANPCQNDAGTCNAGLCQYANKSNGTACDDGNACTLATSCSNGICLNGTTVTCTASDVCHDAGTCNTATGCDNPAITCTPGECQMGGACTPPSGCSFANKADNTPCSGGGSCQSGVCQLPFSPFDRYVTSNFDAGVGLPVAAVTINCNAVFNTGSTSGAASFTGCSGQNFNESNGISIITQTTGNVEAAVLRITGLTITDGGTLTISGERPAIIAVYGSAHVGGEIRVSANTTTKGTGSELGCGDRSAMDGTAEPMGGDGSGGAGGAGFAGPGANGSKGDNYGTGIGTGQAASGTLTLTPLRGGCAGAKGGGTGGGVAGAGGGALQISASRKLRIVGTIHANGGGGQGGADGLTFGDGAGSGGSGGGILLEADSLTIDASARIFANGGTGGEGGDKLATGLTRGAYGFNGQLAWGTTAGPGDNSNGANGGAGGGGATITPANPPNAAGGGSKGGGGGGGGSAGRIYLRFNATGNCVESGYVVSPSTTATDGDYNASGIGFGGNRALPNTTTTCP